MSNSKNTQDDQDPDYATPGPSNDAHQKQYEETARANLARRITAIVEKEFSKEIDTKEKEILQIEGRLHKALKTLHFLRYVIITDFYNRKQCQVAQAAGESKQTRIHPAIKRIIGKSPKTTETLFEDQEIPSANTWLLTSMKTETASPDEMTITNNEIDKRLGNCADAINNDSATLTRASNGKRCQEDYKDESTDDGPPKKIPRYVPPKSGIPEPQVPSRGARYKIRKRIIVGNISKWISPDWREDAASHKWTMYVRGTKENPDISDFVGKIRFFLHPSYRPNDVVEITSPPFHLSRRGWGEFPVRVQLHFKNPLNKPMDIIHHLKLDRTYTGLQTLGSETVVDVWIKSTADVSGVEGEKTENSKSKHFFCDVAGTIKQEPPDTEKSSSNENTPYEVADWSERIKAEVETRDEVSSHVYLEHDYVNFPDNNTLELWEKENNVTISHSPPRNAIRDQHSSLNSPVMNGDSGSQLSYSAGLTIASQEIVETCEADGPRTEAVQTPRIFNGSCGTVRDFTTIAGNGEPEITTEACEPSHQGTNASNAQTSRDVQTMASNLECSSPKLQPLRIAIPAAFEALRRSIKMPNNQTKQILVMRDNKLIPVNATSPEKNRSSKIGMAASTIVSTSVPALKLPKSNVQRASVSLLKKSNVGNSTSMLFTLSSKNSLLLDSTNHIPALKLVEPTTPNARRLYLVEKKMPHRTTLGILSKTKSKLKEASAGEISSGNCKLVTKPKITLGKDRIGTTSKKNYYQEILRSIDDVRMTDVSALVRFIIRRLPLVTERATDPEYKNLHPYAVASEREFLDSNVAKQRALEWYRAKHVKSFLKKKCITEEQQWTVKEIMIWSRLHGHTPIRSLPNVAARNACGKSAEKNHPCDTPETNPCTFTEPTGLLELLHSAHETKGATGTENKCDNEIEIIDVESITDSKSAKGEETCKKTERRSIISLGIPEKIVALQSYVCDTTRQIGVKLEPEEIVPGVMHCAPARLMVRAVQCLLEDLLRSSLAKAWERSIDGGCPDTITLEDVRGAILDREEFDVFTNKGLGSHHCPND